MMNQRFSQLKTISPLVWVMGVFALAVAFVAVGIGVAVGVPLGLWAAAQRGDLLDQVAYRGEAFDDRPSK